MEAPITTHPSPCMTPSGTVLLFGFLMCASQKFVYDHISKCTNLSNEKKPKNMLQQGYYLTPGIQGGLEKWSPSGNRPCFQTP